MRLSIFFLSCFFLNQLAWSQQPEGIGPSSADLLLAAEEGTNWLYSTRDYAGSRYSPLAQIDRHNANKLTPVCINQLGTMNDFQTAPLVFEGMMYLSSGSETFAINAATCKLQWQHVWPYQGINGNTTNRGVAIKDGYVIRGTADGYLIALDALDGDLLWSQQIAKPTLGEHFTMPPMIYDDLVLIGPAGGDNGVSGWVGGFNLFDGMEVWRFYTVPTSSADDNPLGVKIGGGSVWTPFSLDTETESLYVAVTNPAPNFLPIVSQDNNLYTNSLVSLNVRNGDLRWFKQLILADEHGWDLTQVSPLFTATIDEVERQLIVTTGKDGLLRVLDRNSHEELYEEAVTQQENVQSPISLSGTYTCPGVSGGVLWNGPALEPNESLIITPSINLCSTFYRSQETRYSEGQNYFDGVAISDLSTLSGWLTAMDMKTGQLKWQYETKLPMIAAVTTTAGGLVLSGEMNGDFIVLNSADGRELYRFNTGGAIGAGIVTYSVNGKQFIAVASGHPSEYQINGSMGAPTLIVFSVND